MSRLERVITTIFVLWVAAVVAIIIWFLTHKQVTGGHYVADGFKRTYSLDSQALLLWSGLVTGLALVAGLVAWAWMSSSNSQPTKKASTQ